MVCLRRRMHIDRQRVDVLVSPSVTGYPYYLALAKLMRRYFNTRDLQLCGIWL